MPDAGTTPVKRINNAKLGVVDSSGYR